MRLAPSQKPHDVLAWNFESLQHASLAPETCIYSLDYSDFNKEHSSIELAMISFAFAQNWSTYATTPMAGYLKSTISNKLAKSSLTKTVNYCNTNLQFDSGMFSGSRNTM